MHNNPKSACTRRQLAHSLDRCPALHPERPAVPAHGTTSSQRSPRKPATRHTEYPNPSQHLQKKRLVIRELYQKKTTPSSVFLHVFRVPHTFAEPRVVAILTCPSPHDFAVIHDVDNPETRELLNLNFHHSTSFCLTCDTRIVTSISSCCKPSGHVFRKEFQSFPKLS